MKLRRIVMLWATLLLLPVGWSAGAQVDTAGQKRFAFLADVDGVHQAQVVVGMDETTLLVWVQESEGTLDLFVSTSKGRGAFSTPLRLNHEPVNSYTGDEARPDVAVGPGGAVAVAWTSHDMSMMVAVGKDNGRSFSDPIQLNQDESEAGRTMPVIAFSSDGAVHAVWLDARTAPPGREEPANLFYGHVKDGIAREESLTASQEASVCGCCRPFISIDRQNDIEIAFRNTTTSGYRDIYLIHGKSDGAFTAPQPASPAIWEINGCPSVGPVVLDGMTLWKDGSAGHWRLLSASSPEREPAVILQDREGEVKLTYAPRRVSGSQDLVLTGGRPSGFLLKRHGSGWGIMSDDLPQWASSAALLGERLLLVGNSEGRLKIQEMGLPEKDIQGQPGIVR